MTPNHFSSFVAQIVQNDIAAHQGSVDSIGEEAQRLMAVEGGAEAQGLKVKMEDMNAVWDDIQNKSRQKQDMLEDGLREVTSLLFFVLFWMCVWVGGCYLQCIIQAFQFPLLETSKARKWF